MMQTNEYTHPLSQVELKQPKILLKTFCMQSWAMYHKLQTLRRNIRHAREDRNVPKKPLNCVRVPVIPQEYQLTVKGKQVLVIENRAGNILFIFSLEQGI